MLIEWRPNGGEIPVETARVDEMPHYGIDDSELVKPASGQASGSCVVCVASGSTRRLTGVLFAPSQCMEGGRSRDLERSLKKFEDTIRESQRVRQYAEDVMRQQPTWPGSGPLDKPRSSDWSQSTE
jgi:hypothetical protein